MLSRHICQLFIYVVPPASVVRERERERERVAVSIPAVLLLLCAKSRMLSASRRQPHLLHINTADRRQIWSMDKSGRCATLSGFLHTHIVRCR